MKTHRINTTNLGLDFVHSKTKLQILLESLEDKTKSHTNMMQGYLWACRNEVNWKPKSLLQVCMEGKTLVYDIAQYTSPNDVSVLYDTEPFFDPKTFIDTGFTNLWCP